MPFEPCEVVLALLLSGAVELLVVGKKMAESRADRGEIPGVNEAARTW